MFIGQAFESFVNFINDHGLWLLSSIDYILTNLTNLIYNLMSHVPFILFAVIIIIIPLFKKGTKLSFFLIFSFIYIYSLGYWDSTIQTLSIIFVGLIISLVIGIPLGILGAVYTRFNNILRPILDFLQTMPSFVYLLPAVTFFGTGNTAAIIAIVIYAIAPVIRLTTLGIKEVEVELIEASDAFGSTKMQKLLGVQIPIAKKTIMTGVNQTIMMSLSMVVIAAMIGAEGLGTIVYTAVATLDLATAFESGLAIVFLAISLDRLTQLYSKDSREMKKIFKIIYSILVILSLLYSIGSIITEKYYTKNIEYIYVATNDSWADHVAMTELYTYIIEEETEYKIITESLDSTYIIVSLANKDNDIYFANWLPTGQALYDEYGDQMEYIATGFEDAAIGIVVPNYMTDVDSIADLNGIEDELGNSFYGIEPGSQTAKISNNIIDDYDLNLKQETSSTSAMLQELDSAIDKEEPIAVTLWTPHWAFAEYDIKMLEDPELSMGAGDTLSTYSRLGFSKDYPELVEIIQEVSLRTEELSDLMSRLNGEDVNDYEEIVGDFLDDNTNIYSFEE